MGINSKSVEIVKPKYHHVLKFQMDVLLSTKSDLKSVIFHNKDTNEIPFQQ